jgi:hypothetical protein
MNDLHSLVLLNYAGSTEVVHKIVFTLNFLKFHNAVIKVRSFKRALCCLAFHHFPLFSFQGAAEDTQCTLKIEQCKNEKV